MTSIYEDLKQNSTDDIGYYRYHHDMIAGELQIRWNQHILINFLSTATNTVLLRKGLFISGKEGGWLKPNINKNNTVAEDKKEWDYYWEIYALFLQHLKDLNMDTKYVWLPRERRGKDFTMIQNKVTEKTLSKWQRNNVKLYKCIADEEYDLKFFHDMVVDINLRDFQNKRLRNFKEEYVNLQYLIEKQLIEEYDINKQKYEITNERPTKRQKRWSPRLLMILGDVPSNEVLSFNLKF